MLKEKQEVIIAGKKYKIVGGENADYINRVAGYVDAKMLELMEMNNELTHESAAVLACVNIADELFKAEENADNLRGQVGELIASVNAASSVSTGGKKGK